MLALMSGCVGGLRGDWEMEAREGEEQAGNGELREYVEGLRSAGQLLEKGESSFWVGREMERRRGIES